MARAQDRAANDPFAFWFLGFWGSVAAEEADQRANLSNKIPVPDSEPFTKIHKGLSELAKSRLSDGHLKYIAALLYASAMCENRMESRAQDKRAEVRLLEGLHSLQVRARREIDALKEAFGCNPERIDMHKKALLALADERAAIYRRAAELAMPQESPFVAGVQWVFKQIGLRSGRKDLDRIFKQAGEDGGAARTCSMLRAYFYSAIRSPRKVFNRHPRLLLHRYPALPIDLAYFNVVSYLRLICGMTKMEAYQFAGEIVHAYQHNWDESQRKNWSQIAEVRFKRFANRYQAYLSPHLNRLL